MTMPRTLDYFQQILQGMHRQDFYEELYIILTLRLQTDAPDTSMDAVLYQLFSLAATTSVHKSVHLM